MTPAEESVDTLAANLRMGQRAVFPRVQQDRLILDLRTVLPKQDIELVEAIRALDQTDAQESSEPASVDSSAE